MSENPDIARSVLVLGGARSGKSRFAEALAARSPRPVTYVATAEAGDAEMAERIAVHRARRPAAWRTVEAPMALAEAITAAVEGGALVLVDCLTLWLGNLVLAEAEAAATIAPAQDRLLRAIAAARGGIVLVSNEVGAGIVPDNRLARDFRDAQGRLNQAVAAAVTDVVQVVAGCPVVLKPAPAPEIRL